MAEPDPLTTPVQFAPNEGFLRRFPADGIHLKDDRTVSSAAFENDKGTNRMSVNWLARSSVESTLARLPGYGAALLTAQDYWDEEQVIEYTPVSSPPNPAHCDVVGEKNRSRMRRLAKAVRKVYLPP